MFIKWRRSFNKGIPEIDSEHRYLVTLINGLHDDFITNKSKKCLSSTFIHLIRYVDEHFKNEESLMEAIEYPLMEEHQKHHEDLTDNLYDLSEKFISGEENVSEEVIIFLTEWLYVHILSEDGKIASFLDGKGTPDNWQHNPAFLDSSSSDFKKCTLCDKKWATFDDLAKDNNIEVQEPMIDEENHLYNLILFNCSCGTSLACQLTDFIHNCNLPFELEERKDIQEKPVYCLKKNDSSRCISKCACSYTAKILSLMKGHKPNH